MFRGEQAQEREDREPVAAIRWIREPGAQDRDLHEDLLLDRLTVGSAGAVLRPASMMNPGLSFASMTFGRTSGCGR